VGSALGANEASAKIARIPATVSAAVRQGGQRKCLHT
jgi:hypothetical protein